MAKKRTRATRRHFLKSVAATALLPSTALPKEPEEPREIIKIWHIRLFKPQAPAPLTAAQALSEFVRSRYGKFLTEEQFAEVARQIEQNLRSAERLRSVKLTNADEPDVIFRAIP